MEYFERHLKVFNKKRDYMDLGKPSYILAHVNSHILQLVQNVT